jgi:hypothetical protein
VREKVEVEVEAEVVGKTIRGLFNRSQCFGMVSRSSVPQGQTYSCVCVFLSPTCTAAWSLTSNRSATCPPRLLEVMRVSMVKES